MAQTNVHEGPYGSISDDASPGLLFLKKVLAAMDALQPPFDLAKHFIDPFATLTINNDAPVPVSQLSTMFEMRSKRLAKFHHELQKAWDVEAGRDMNGDPRRTVIFESTSVTTFVDDPNQTEARVKEFSVIEVKANSTSELKAESIRTVMDARPVEALRSRLQNS